MVSSVCKPWRDLITNLSTFRTAAEGLCFKLDLQVLNVTSYGSLGYKLQYPKILWNNTSPLFQFVQTNPSRHLLIELYRLTS